MSFDIDNRVRLTTFREHVLSDLRRAARLVVRIQDEIDPQVRIATPEGDYLIAMTLPAADAERRALLDQLAIFMAWKQAVGFTWACEIAEPDAVYCVGVTRSEKRTAFSAIVREPRPWSSSSFTAVRWLSPRSIEPALVALLPLAPRPLTPKEVSGLQPLFGAQGRFPAVHVPTGEVRGV